MPPPPDGVTVAICCHNSAARLTPTLRHLADQQTDPAIPWEVLIIDNASTDATASVAASLWPTPPPAPLRIVAEPRPGLQFVREKAYAEARHPIISFIDDDNWVCRDWVTRVADIMARHPDVGACGGPSEAVCESPPPPWFDWVKHCYAVGTQGDAPSEGHRRILWGAGMSVRREAVDRLIRLGFRSILVGRQGNSLTAGEDAELCFALRLSGWNLWYDPTLRLRHYIPTSRLNWRYVRRLHRGFGVSLADPYLHVLGEGIGDCPPHKMRWRWVFSRELWYALRSPGGFWRLFQAADHEGDAALLAAEHRAGRLEALWRQRRIYDRRVRALSIAPWRARQRYPSAG